MGVVVPGEEPLAERTGVFDGVEARRKVGLVAVPAQGAHRHVVGRGDAQPL
jgi:hypothetical protein